MSDAVDARPWPGRRRTAPDRWARIELRDLRTMGVHGVLPEERERAQPFALDLDVWLDARAASSSDSLADTVDYGALCDLAIRVVSERSYQLLEALAAAVAGALLDADQRIERVSATVRKVRPPVPADLGSVGVRVTRSRARPAGEATPVP